jgi:hypothetical protein
VSAICQVQKPLILDCDLLSTILKEPAVQGTFCFCYIDTVYIIENQTIAFGNCLINDVEGCKVLIIRDTSVSNIKRECDRVCFIEVFNCAPHPDYRLQRKIKRHKYITLCMGHSISKPYIRLIYKKNSNKTYTLKILGIF